jgi:hypothetical protein
VENKFDIFDGYYAIDAKSNENSHKVSGISVLARSERKIFIRLREHVW